MTSPTRPDTTSPQDPTAQHVLRRIQGLHLDLPERAEVTLDFGRYPIPDIPYLTIVKWALSSHRDWPLLSGKRAKSDPAAATFGLTDDELRRVLYSDLRRSLWQPTPDGLQLSWDDDHMRLTVGWSPRVAQADARPAFATIGGVLNPSTVNLIHAQPPSAEAFRQAIADASEPHQPPRPAFRVEIGILYLPADRYPGANAEDRAQRLYQKFKEVALRNHSRVTFSDSTLSIEFADYMSVRLSGLRKDLRILADLPQFSSPSTHPGAPPAGSRGYPSAQLGTDLRAIEHAFAIPGYRAQRRARRRELATGLTYQSVAQAFQQYDAAFTPERLTRLNSALLDAAHNGRHGKAFDELFSFGGLVIGERHDRPDAFQFATEHMPEMKKAGMTRFICETFDQDYQDELDTFVFGNTDTMDRKLQNYVERIDAGRDKASPVKHNAVKEFLQEARRNDIRVVAAEHSAAFFALGAGRITGHENARSYDQEKRLAHFNRVAANHKLDKSIDVHITGGGHANTTDFGYPGVSQLTGFPAVTVRTGGFRHLRTYPENRGYRRTGIPTHPPIDHSTPSSSSSVATSPAKHHRHKAQERPEALGIPI